MDKKINKLTWLGAITLIIVVVIGFKAFNQEFPVGSVAVGNEYKSVRVGSLTASTTSGTLVQAGQKVLGSVVVPVTSGQTIDIYDCATGANFASTTLSTKVATIPTSAVSGTYTFDIQLNRGLVLFASTTPSTETIITYR